MQETNVTPKKSPMSFFFTLGDKATGGDPVRKATFDYCMMWILFLSFLTISIRNWVFFFMTWDVSFVTWALIGGAISYFQYFALVAFYQKWQSIKNVYKDLNPGDTPKLEKVKEDSVEEMMGEFKDG